MRRKQQIQAMQQELALLRQTIDSGKELAALATGAAQQLKKPNLKAIAVQELDREIHGLIGAAAARYRFYQTIVAQEVKKALKPVHDQLDDLQATVDAMAEAEGIDPEKARKGKKHRR